ncbi:hypothetical protein [Salinisphaera sp.]|uniref:hypothetical protein n=1 Tax=Salinisphaera sp. TaxID=1914330 RepID=UPI002D782382|nr:hypothetical protein [Salinisphaera sp.]HET7314809.1 hypothetical protein [Salinisphaera sp.]
MINLMACVDGGGQRTKAAAGAASYETSTAPRLHEPVGSNLDLSAGLLHNAALI